MEINNKQKNRNRLSNSQFNDEEETMTYMSEMKKISYLNTQEDIFKSVFNGINSQKSVFDQSAVFDTHIKDRG